MNTKKNVFVFQIPICTPEKNDCLRNTTIEDTDCFQQCSGILVTSYRGEEIENYELPNFISMLGAYFGEKMNTFKDMEESFKG